jgi:hypothetical protein
MIGSYFIQIAMAREIFTRSVQMGATEHNLHLPQALTVGFLLGHPMERGLHFRRIVLENITSTL